MKFRTLFVQVTAFCLACASGLVASAATLYSIDKDAPTLREIDPLTGATIVDSAVPITEISSINGGRGLATEPGTQTLYALLDISAGVGSTRTLATIDPDTGEATSIGNVSTGGTDEFESITFAEDGTLYGVTEQAKAERLYTINTSNASVSVVGVLSENPNLDDEAIAFNPQDYLIYRGSGVSVGAVYQSVDPDPFSTSGITTSGDSFFGMRALVFESADITTETFLMSVVMAGDDDFFSITNTGVATDLGAMDHKSKGLAFVVPEPSTTAMLITIICLVASTGSRRRSQARR